MTKKDYIEIARVLRDTLVDNAEDNSIFYMLNEYRNKIIIALCNIFTKDNPRFNKIRFIEATRYIKWLTIKM